MLLVFWNYKFMLEGHEFRSLFSCSAYLGLDNGNKVYFKQDTAPEQISHYTKLKKIRSNWVFTLNLHNKNGINKQIESE